MRSDERTEKTDQYSSVAMRGDDVSQGNSGEGTLGSVDAFQKAKKAEIKKAASSKHFYFMLLGISIVCEVTATISLKFAEGFTVVVPSIITIIGYAASFTLLVRILEHMPLGLVYGIWGGIGSMLTMLAGVIIWGEPFTPLMALGLGLVVVGVYFLNTGTDELEAQRAQREGK